MGRVSNGETVAFMSYYAQAAIWASDAAWGFVGDKIVGIPTAVVSTVIGGVFAARLGGSWRPGMIGGGLGAIGGPIIVFLGAFAFNLLRFPPAHEDNFETLSQRLTSVENRIPQPDPRIETISPRLSVLEGQVKLFSRIDKFQICLGKLDPLIREMEQETEAAKGQILSPPVVSPRLGPPPAMMLPNTLRKIDDIYKDCGQDPKIDILAEPTGEQLDNKVRGEPEGIDSDKSHQFRRIYYKSLRAGSVVQDLKDYLSSQIEVSKEAIAQSYHP